MSLLSVQQILVMYQTRKSDLETQYCKYYMIYSYTKPNTRRSSLADVTLNVSSF